MEFWELYNIKEKYVNEVLTFTTRSYTINFDVPNTVKEEWQYYYEKGFDFVFSANTF